MWWERANSARTTFTKHFWVYIILDSRRIGIFVINRESINDALINVRLLFAKLDSRRNRAVVSTALTLFSSSTFLERDDERNLGARGVRYMRIEVEQTKQPFTCIRYFFIRPCVFCERERSRDFSTLHFERGAEGMRKTTGGEEKKNPSRGRNRTWRKGGEWVRVDIECEAAWAESWGW